MWHHYVEEKQHVWIGDFRLPVQSNRGYDPRREERGLQPVIRSLESSGRSLICTKLYYLPSYLYLSSFHKLYIYIYLFNSLSLYRAICFPHFTRLPKELQDGAADHRRQNLQAQRQGGKASRRWWSVDKGNHPKMGLFQVSELLWIIINWPYIYNII